MYTYADFLYMYRCIFAQIYRWIYKYIHIYIYIQCGEKKPWRGHCRRSEEDGTYIPIQQIGCIYVLTSSASTHVFGEHQTWHPKSVSPSIPNWCKTQFWAWLGMKGLNLPMCLTSLYPRFHWQINFNSPSSSKRWSKESWRVMIWQEHPNCFMDCATSKQRSTESAWNMTTCVRPSHKIYSTKLERFLHVKELWNCQGLFPSAFPNPKAVEEFIKNKSTNAQDLAGRDVAPKVVVVKSMVLCI